MSYIPYCPSFTFTLCFPFQYVMFYFCKQIQVRQNDIQEMKAIASEIDIIESINHPRLIKYYGVEVYRVKQI